jgi:hypothetical protein
MRAADLLENLAYWRVREQRIVGEQRGGETFTAMRSNVFMTMLFSMSVQIVLS